MGACACTALGTTYASYRHGREFALRFGADEAAAAIWPLIVDGLLNRALKRHRVKTIGETTCEIAEKGETSDEMASVMRVAAVPGESRPVEPTAEQRLWAYYVTERANGRTPTGAELDRIAGTNNCGRHCRGRGGSRTRQATAAGQGSGDRRWPVPLAWRGAPMPLADQREAVAWSSSARTRARRSRHHAACSASVSA